MKKKIVAMLCVAMLAAGLCSCGSNDNGTSGADNSAKKPTLKYLVNSMPVDPNDYYAPNKMEEITGYKVDYEMLPAENPVDSLNLKIASGVEYDIVSVGTALELRALFDTFARQGALAELDELIDKYGPNIEKYVDPLCWEMTDVDGKRYVIANMDPTAIPEGNTWNTFVVRDDLLKKLGMEFPTTLEGFKELLQAIKDQDPGKKGNENIPFTFCSLNDISILKAPFGIYFEWNDVDGTMIPVVEDPRYKEYLLYMKDLYDNGLIDMEFPANQVSNVDEKIASGKSAIAVAPLYNFGNYVDSLKEVVPDAELNAYTALANKDGVVGTATTSGINRLTVIPAASKHKEDAIKYINAKLDPETFKTMVIGEEGVHYEMKDGMPTPIQPAFGEQMNDAHNFITGADDENYRTYWKQCRLRKDERNYEMVDKTLMSQPEVARVNPLNIAPLLPAYAKNAATLSSMLRDFEIAVITGAKDISELDAFAKQYMAEGGQDAKTEINEWWSGYRDEFYEKYPNNKLS